VTVPAPADPADLPENADVCVVGTGVMGAWTAFWARAGGAGPDEDWGGGRSVTLLDAWGAGHLRATSSDEHRIIRSAHGEDRFCARWSRRALRHWERFEQEWNVPLFHRSGVLWFSASETSWEADSEATLRSLGIPVERLDPAAITARWPVIDPAGAAFGVFEPEAGFLMARRGVAATVAAFQRAGGRYALAAVRPGRSQGRSVLDIVDQAGRRWLRPLERRANRGPG
jgi:sarcosine oxidase subunit beta